MTLNDLLYDGCTFQGNVEVVSFHDERDHLMWSGDGESLPYDEDDGYCCKAGEAVYLGSPGHYYPKKDN